MITCHGKFEPSEIWYLKDNEECYNRRMEKGICPICDKEVVMVFGKRFNNQSDKIQRAVKRKAEILFDKCKKELDYKYSGITRNGSKFNATFYYGLNKEIHRNGKIIAIKQYALNHNDKGSLIKELKV